MKRMPVQLYHFGERQMWYRLHWSEAYLQQTQNHHKEKVEACFKYYYVGTSPEFEPFLGEISPQPLKTLGFFFLGQTGSN